MCAKHYVAQAESTEASDPSFEASVRQRVAAAKADRLNVSVLDRPTRYDRSFSLTDAFAVTVTDQRLAFASIVDDLRLDLLRAECQAVHHEARYSSEFRDHFATKLQVTFRMSRQRRAYVSRQHDRQLAARAIQARQRGVTSSRRYRDLQVDRD